LGYLPRKNPVAYNVFGGTLNLAWSINIFSHIGTVRPAYLGSHSGRTRCRLGQKQYEYLYMQNGAALSRHILSVLYIIYWSLTCGKPFRDYIPYSGLIV